MTIIDRDTRIRHIRRFYQILDQLEIRVAGKRKLGEVDGRMGWPRRGLYIFFEPGEMRLTSGLGARVTRVGTHALKAGGKSTLWGRLRAHRGSLGGPRPGGGNHRGSIFRLHVGTALIRRDAWPEAVASDWGVGRSAKRPVCDREYPIEQAVSAHICAMPFLWIAIDDEPGPDSLRGYIERNAIALLSNYNVGDAPVDPPSPDWLGHWATSEYVRRSGLWNVNHVADSYDPAFLDVFGQHLPG